jgi:hypothetical protein
MPTDDRPKTIDEVRSTYGFSSISRELAAEIMELPDPAIVVEQHGDAQAIAA